MREKAVFAVEDLISRAEAVLRGEPYDPECGSPAEYAQALANRAIANIQFGTHMGLWSFADDKGMLFAWAKRIGVINQR